MGTVAEAAVLPEPYQGARDVDIAGQMGLKVPVIVPLLRAAAFLCLVMSVMLFAEKIYMAAVVLGVRRPEERYKSEPLRNDVEVESSAFPMVLVQIPMYNEKEVIFSPLRTLGGFLGLSSRGRGGGGPRARD